MKWVPWSTPENVTESRPRYPSYGRYLDEFNPGEVFAHPRGITFHPALAQEFAGTFMESCPLFLTSTYPRELGFEDQLVSPLMVLATTLSLGVQNESEKAVAHLGYYDVCFPRPTYVGDTLRALTRVKERKERGAGEPGIAHVQTLGLNQRGEVAVRYERKIMIPSRPAGVPVSAPTRQEAIEFPWPESPEILLPPKAALPSSSVSGSQWTGKAGYFEDFSVGDILFHPNGRDVTDEHVPWTYRLGNTHPLHFDSVYTRALPPPMGGEPVVYGGLVFSWIAGLASRDTSENMLWDLGYTQGYHTQPVRSGDTLFAVSRVLMKEEGPETGAGIVTLQLIGIKNMHGKEAYSKHGMSLFIRENDKKKLNLDKIPQKVFEIERKLWVRKTGRS